MLHIDDLHMDLLLLSNKLLVFCRTKYQLKVLLEILSLESIRFKENKAIIRGQFMALS